jgi:pimeloyl-ACP methyl ester carboxylesterase
MRKIKSLLTWILLIILTIYCVRIFEALRMRDLDVEHSTTLSAEFSARTHAQLDWNGYLELEKEIAAEAAQLLAVRSGEAGKLNRYARDAVANPDNYPTNWNRSYVKTPDVIRGGAVLLHGLTDSPYSWRPMADIFYDQGFRAWVPRMPGHGFVVGDLDQSHHEDWSAVVALTMLEARDNLSEDQPLILGGYSNGATLALNYAIDCQTDDSLPCPDAILLVSPAIAVSPVAVLARAHRVFSWIPGLEKFSWESIFPEVDPYKFTSFPKSAGWETSDLSRTMRDRLSSAGPLPSILAFQSVVDATVRTDAVLTFFASLPQGGHELVFYDLNRYEVFSDWLSVNLQNVEKFGERGPFPFDVTVLSNQKVGSREISDYRLPAGETAFSVNATDLVWPREVYSLSHIALPFPPDDPIYGEEGTAVGIHRPLGERDMLYLGAEYFQRLRHNPFYGYQETRIIQWLEEVRSSKD